MQAQGQFVPSEAVRPGMTDEAKVGPPVVFVDLDDTLFSSSHKHVAAGTPEPWESAAVDRAGEPLSFMGPKQARMLRWLMRQAVLVPTTGRNAAALDRVRLPALAEGRCHAICSFGGLIRQPDGQPEPRWHRHIQPLAEQHAHELHRFVATALALAESHRVDVRAKVVGEQDLPLYVSVKHNASDAAALARLAEHLHAALPGATWRLHLNDTQLAVMPPHLDKTHAVRHFVQHLADRPAFTLGIGDSLSDLGFLAACDYAMMPQGSQIVRELFGAWSCP